MHAIFAGKVEAATAQTAAFRQDPCPSEILHASIKGYESCLICPGSTAWNLPVRYCSYINQELRMRSL